jgi:WD40 repeat protein
MRGVAISANGKYALTTSDENAELWDVSSGERIRQLVGHTKMVHAAAFFPDGKHILTSSEDGTARIWTTNTQDWLQEACEQMQRDLSLAERKLYRITNTRPTCPKFKASAN